MTEELTEKTAETSLMGRLGPIAIGNRGILLATMDDVFRFAKAIALSQLCPPGFSETDCFLIIANGLEVGMSPMAALASTYIVNNRATIFGDMPLALVRQSGLLEDYQQEFMGAPYQDDFRCVVTTKRKGQPKSIVTDYSILDAKTAEVWGRTFERNGKTVKSPWVTNPRRMLMFRARGFNLRDNFGDVLKGCSIAELDDGAEPGFEHAKPVLGHVVTPRFETPLSTKRRGRPPKQSAAQPDLVPASQEPVAEPEPKPATPPPKGPDGPKAPPQTEDKTTSPVWEINQRLAKAGIAPEKFVEFMYKNAYLEAADVEEIRIGHIGIERVDPDGLSLALQNWTLVLEEIKKL